MKLSIIMPIYNGANHIKKTIPYILSSKYMDFELLLINDGSNDKSLAICNKYASNDSRIVVIDKKNGGIAEARNYGVNNSKGEYLAFVDQDDYIELDTIMYSLEPKTEDIILFSTVKDYGNCLVECDTIYSSNRYCSKKEIFNNCIWPMVYPSSNVGNVSYFGHVWQGIYKKRIINEANIQFKRFVSIEDDYVFLLEVLVHSNSVATIAKIGYRWFNNLQSTTYKKVYIENMQEKCEKYYSFVDELLTQVEFYDKAHQDKYLIMSKQVLGVRLIINEGNSKSFFDSLRIVKKFRLDNKTSFRGKYLGQGASRKSAKLIFELLKKNMVLCALLVQKCINILHILQNIKCYTKILKNQCGDK